jgi:DNA-directed RNA polymerase specialized sigma24 family protein
MTTIITPDQQLAAHKYAKDFQRASDAAKSPERRLEASQDLAAARAVLTAPQVVLLNLVAGYGRNVDAVAKTHDLPLKVVSDSLADALAKIAAVYEARA